MKTLILYMDGQGYKKENEVLTPTNFNKQISLNILIPEGIDIESYFNKIVKYASYECAGDKNDN